MGDRNEIVGHMEQGLPTYENKQPVKRSLHNLGHKRWKEIPNLGSIFCNDKKVYNRLKYKLYAPYDSYDMTARVHTDFVQENRSATICHIGYGTKNTS